jgi:dipeptidase D
MAIHLLEPSALWRSFADLNAVPRPSKKEERIRKFMLNFGQGLGLETIEDGIGNVIIKKPATGGMENRVTVILQSHLDMVHQKNETTVFDFDQEGIKMRIDGDWVLAEGTTLGADNGIGVAAIMALLQSDDIPHPALEALFTIDEETGMTGAKELDGSLLSGEILLNLDTEDDDELSVGCAGGIDTNTSYAYQEIAVKSGSHIVEITINGLLGGHSGMDIDKGRGNANKLIARLIWKLAKQVPLQLISFDGGSLRNAIPREALAVIAVAEGQETIAKEALHKETAIFLEEYKAIESYFKISVNSIKNDEKAMSDSDFNNVINCLCSIQNGVFRMSPDIIGLVEASSSLARVIIKNGSFTTQSLQRSSVESTKDEVAMSIRANFELIGATVTQGGDYPGWKPNTDSKILQLMREIYLELFHEEPKVKACHAGLECGILGLHLPSVDMISFGPNIRAAHSPDEKVQLSSVQKFWGFYLKTLAQIPEKA